jgi:hypothetical protein
MSHSYNGDLSNVTNYLTKTISNTTDPGTITVTTTTAHGFSTNDWVEVFGVASPADVGANGWFKIVVVSPTQFQLVGSTSSGAYVSGGTVFNVSLTPAIQLPDDGDALTAASIQAPLQALADRTQFLMAPASQAFSLVGSSFATSVQFPPKSNYRPALVAIADNTQWLKDRVPVYTLAGYSFDTQSGAGVQLGNGTTTGISPTPVNYVVFPAVTGVQAGDLVEFEISSSIALGPYTATSITSGFQLQANQAGFGYADVADAHMTFRAGLVGLAGTDTTTFGFTFKAVYQAAHAGTHALRLVVSQTGADMHDVTKWDSFAYHAFAKVLRAT